MQGSTIRTLVFGGVGLILFILGIIRIMRSRSFRAHAAPARATIVRYQTDLGANSSTIYRPVVEFHTRDGQRVVATSPTADNIGHGRAGRQVRVWYDTGDPSRIRLTGIRGSKTTLGVVLIIVALLCGLAGWLNAGT